MAAEFYRSYLLGYLFWLGIPLGSLVVLLTLVLTGGRWGRALARPALTCVRILPWWGLLFLPVLTGLKVLYPWASGEAEAHQALHFSSPYFQIRVILYFAFWSVLAGWFSRKWPPGDFESWRRKREVQFIAGGGLLGMLFTVSFAAIDWVMPLEPHWHSTVYGALWFTGWTLEALAFLVAAAALSGIRGGRKMDAALGRDLGNLILSLLLFWAYLAYSQYLIVWSANIPREAAWYLSRLSGPWHALAAVNWTAFFVLPLAALFFRALKERAEFLAGVSAWILLGRLLDMAWLILPAAGGDTAVVYWPRVFLPALVGAVWLCFYVGYNNGGRTSP